MSVNQLILIFRSRWRLMAKVFAAVMILALLYTFLVTKQYTATASVVIDTHQDPVSPTGLTDGLLLSQVATEVNTISSERVAVRAVKELKLGEIPKMKEAWLSKTGGQGDINVWIADGLLDHNITVGTGKAKIGNIISIEAKWPDPKMAAALANAFAQAAIDTNIELRIEPAKQFAKWFDLHSQELRTELVSKQKRLSDYENANGLVATDEKLDVENARLAELSSQLVEIQGQRQEAQSRQRQAGADNQSLPEVLQSPVIQKLKSDLSDAEAKQADIAGNLGKNHPDYQAAAAEVESLQARIRRESDKIAGGLGSNTQISLRREADIRAALDLQKKRVLELKHKHDDAAVLESDVSTAQRDLDAVTQRYAQSSLESQAQQTNLVQLTTATEPFKASSPKKTLNILAAIILGGILAVGAALIAERNDPRMRDDEELIKMLGVPLLVKIGSVKVKDATAGRGVDAVRPHLEPTVI